MSFLEIKDKWLIWYEDYKTLLGKNEEKKLHNELLPEHTEDEWEKYHIARKIIKQSFEKEGKTKARFVH
jgi:hypothetical protein